jgi:hypothetical protein
MKKLISVVALLALIVSSSALTVLWDANDPSEGIINYRVYWAQGTGPFQFLADTGTVTSYTLTNAAPGVYRFFITARNFWTVESDPSQVASTPPAPTSPKMKMLYIVIGTKTNAIVNFQ